MMEWLNGMILGRVVPLLLIGVGIFYGFRLGFFPFLAPGRTLGAMRGQGRDGGSSVRAMSLALAGTLGVGNLVGVASALSLGGAGAILWMWISALCAMLLKYAEILLAMLYRRWEAGGWHGSAMRYIRACFSRRGFPLVGKVLAGVFALLCVVNALTMGSMIQIHAVSEAWQGVAGVSPFVVGGILSVTVFFLLRGGTARILSVSAMLVPLMTAGFLILSLTVLLLRRETIPTAVKGILHDAFSLEAATGGVGGFFLGRQIRYGTMRGLISNEAGCGTAPMAHATAEGAEPVRQAVLGIFEVFADTVLLCTVTALVILCSGVPLDREEYMMITVDAYATVFGAPAAYFLAVAVLLFGFATVICWGHYGMEAVADLSPRPWLRTGFCVLYSASVLVGALGTARGIWQAADLAIGLMTLINLPVLCLMSGEVRRETVGFFARQKRSKTFTKRSGLHQDPGRKP